MTAVTSAADDPADVPSDIPNSNRAAILGNRRRMFGRLRDGAASELSFGGPDLK